MNDPVRCSVSILRNTRLPVRSDRRGFSISGVRTATPFEPPRRRFDVCNIAACAFRDHCSWVFYRHAATEAVNKFHVRPERPIARQTFDRPLRGIGCKIAGTVLFSIMFAAIRWLGPSFPLGEIVFFRSLVGAGRGDHCGVCIRRTFAARDFEYPQPCPALGRRHDCDVLQFCGLYLAASADATAIGFAAPLFVVVMAALFLGERVFVYRWSAVVAGFARCYPHCRAGGGFVARRFLWRAFRPCRARHCRRPRWILIRRMSAHEHSITIAFYFMLTSATVSLFTIVDRLAGSGKLRAGRCCC